MAHEEQAAAAGALDILDGHRIGHVFRVEAAAFVGDADVEALAREHVVDMHLLGAVHPVAVLDGVDQRLFQGKFDAEDLTLLIAMRDEGTLDLLLNPTCFVGVAGDQVFPGALLADFAHGAFLAKLQFRHKLSPA